MADVSSPAPSPTVSPATAILEATVRLIGEGGLQAVRHRRVADAAGVSLGAIPNHFPTRGVLLEQALRLAAKRDIALLERFTLDFQAHAFDTEAWIDAMARALAQDLGEDPIRRLITYELLLASARDERLRDLMEAWIDAYQRFAELGFRAAGSPTPERHGQILVAAITGALLKQLALPEPRFEDDVLRPLLRELITKLVR